MENKEKYIKAFGKNYLSEEVINKGVIDLDNSNFSKQEKEKILKEISPVPKRIMFIQGTQKIPKFIIKNKNK